MLNTSFEFKSKIANNSKTLVKATLTLANGTVRELTGDDIMVGSPSFTESTSSTSSFDIGSAVIGAFSIVLNNYDGRFDTYDFTDATIHPWIGVELSNNRIEWLDKGIFGVEQPESYGATIALSSLDNMRLFEKPYALVVTQYPASLRTIVDDICRVCHVQFDSDTFANNNYVVRESPQDDSLTCLAMLGYVAQVSGNFAKINTRGHLEIKWYPTEEFENEDALDGESFDDATPYASGSVADGGSFDDYSSGDVVDGGEFSLGKFANIYGVSSLTVSTDDVVITGISVTAQNEVVGEGEEGREGETHLEGREGYVLTISDNPLILFGEQIRVAKMIAPRVVGMRFRPFNVSAIGDPAVEAGDPVIITDRKQNWYKSYITNLVYKPGSYESFSCAAETPSRNSATSFSAMTSAIVAARRAIKAERTARERAIEDLAANLTDTSGMFMTAEPQEDGSKIYYMHNKPTLRESEIIWKLTKDAFGISNDGGKTYPYGLSATGTAILEKIYTVGLDANYIKTGALTIQDKTSAKTLFSADIDTGHVTIDGSCITIGTQSLPDAVNNAKVQFGTCTTYYTTAEKKVICPDFILHKGATINVKFTNKNTASSPTLNVNETGAKPIYLGNDPLPLNSAWDSGDTVTFVYNGTQWQVVDSGALSKIKITPDNITLSVANGSIGNRATISLGIGSSMKSATLDMSGVRSAFANDNTYVTVSAGRVTFNSNTFVVNSTHFSVDSVGRIRATAGTIGGFTINANSIYSSDVTLYNKGLRFSNIGSFSSSNLYNDASKKGMSMDLEYGNSYICWSAKKNASDAYYGIVLAYGVTDLPMRSGGSWQREHLHVATYLDMHNYTLYNCTFDQSTCRVSGGGLTGKIWFNQRVNHSSGDISSEHTYLDCYLTFKNGFCTDGYFKRF